MSWSGGSIGKARCARPIKGDGVVDHLQSPGASRLRRTGGRPRVARRRPRGGPGEPLLLSARTGALRKAVLEARPQDLPPALRGHSANDRLHRLRAHERCHLGSAWMSDAATGCGGKHNRSRRFPAPELARRPERTRPGSLPWARSVGRFPNSASPGFSYGRPGPVHGFSGDLASSSSTRLSNSWDRSTVS